MESLKTEMEQIEDLMDQQCREEFDRLFLTELLKLVEK